MPTYRALFKGVVWFGVLANFAFAAFVLFMDPAKLLSSLNLGTVPSTVWIYNYSILLIILSCFYIPAAHDPLRYRANAWLLIVGRLVPASSFFIGTCLGFMPKGFVTLGIGDGAVGLIELFLLVKLIRAEAADVVPLWKLGKTPRLRAPLRRAQHLARGGPLELGDRQRGQQRDHRYRGPAPDRGLYHEAATAPLSLFHRSRLGRARRRGIRHHVCRLSRLR